VTGVQTCALPICAAINYALEIASETATYDGAGDEFKAFISAPIRVPGGVIGFTETIVLRTNAQLWGGGMVNSFFQRIGGTGHAFATQDFAALEAAPSGSTLLPGCIGLRDLMIVDGTLADYAAGPGSTGYGLAMHAYNVMLQNVKVYAPKREKGIYQGAVDRPQLVTNLELASLTQTPFMISEDVVDAIWAVRCGGDGITWASNDAHLGRMWAVTNKTVGVRLLSNSLQAAYIHSYANEEWNVILDGPAHCIGQIEARDGQRGGIWFKFNEAHVGYLRVGNNLRSIATADPAIPPEELCDVRISSRDIVISDGIVRVSKGQVGVRFDGSYLNNDINLLVRPGELTGDDAGKGIGVGQCHVGKTRQSRKYCEGQLVLPPGIHHLAQRSAAIIASVASGYIALNSTSQDKAMASQTKALFSREVPRVMKPTFACTS
jgi:hypothetical protein